MSNIPFPPASSDGSSVAAGYLNLGQKLTCTADGHSGGHANLSMIASLSGTGPSSSLALSYLDISLSASSTSTSLSAAQIAVLFQGISIYRSNYKVLKE